MKKSFVLLSILTTLVLSSVQSQAAGNQFMYKFKVAADKEYWVMPEICEKTYDEPNKRILDITIENKLRDTIDMVNFTGKNNPFMFKYRSIDLDKDGLLTLTVSANQNSVDKTPILSTVKVIPVTTDTINTDNPMYRIICTVNPDTVIYSPDLILKQTKEYYKKILKETKSINNTGKKGELIMKLDKINESIEQTDKNNKPGNEETVLGSLNKSKTELNQIETELASLSPLYLMWYEHIG
jgi:hypothetical protein